MPEGLHEELARDEAIGALKRFSLIQAEKDALTVHRLVQAVTCDGLDQATTQARAESPVRLVSAALPNPLEHTNWLAFGVLLPHALAAARVFNETAIYHQSRAAWVAAEPLLKHALVIREKTLPPGHPDIAQSLGNLAELYRVTSRYAEAEPLLKRAIAISKKALGPDHLDHLGNAAESRQPRVLFLRQHFVV